MNTTQYEDHHEKRLIRLREVMELTSLSKSYIYQLSAQGKFPKRVNLVKGGSSVAWLESEVLAWIEERLTERNLNQ
ncbi:helix-turn-helix transcriptional regulator [Aliidiomarina haloalkalitolerans]|uniref:Transcriptional regulator n=1 Tax=Aliidiomarina haloalkalitolerans TaxID=859059 RepID=A0A432VPK2_9GAMM|nr:AlpA family transcriptional regulator [Aliidiomarina haloalkalitolerans]RUO17995.1 transcriptional regulator [Aliidiomarina haloalkalitolerans]